MQYLAVILGIFGLEFEITEQQLAARVRQAKKDGVIDNFIYGSVSSTYLSAVIDTL